VKLGDVALVLIDFGADSKASSGLISELSGTFPTVPVVAILPERASDHLRSKAIRAGVRDFMMRPVGPDEFRLRIRNAIRSAPSVFSVARETAKREGEMRDTISEVFEGFAEMLRLAGGPGEWRDTDTGLHIARVAYYSRLMGRMIGCGIEKQDLICHSSTLHDIGKVAVPDHILHKPGPLDPDERKTMEVHAVRGHDLLKRYGMRIC
jgi:putative two-component system response regulator